MCQLYSYVIIKPRINEASPCQYSLFMVNSAFNKSFATTAQLNLTTKKKHGAMWLWLSASLRRCELSKCHPQSARRMLENPLRFCSHQICHSNATGWWYTYPLKNMSSSVGIILPNIWKVIKYVPNLYIYIYIYISTRIYPYFPMVFRALSHAVGPCLAPKSLVSPTLAVIGVGRSVSIKDVLFWGSNG